MIAVLHLPRGRGKAEGLARFRALMGLSGQAVTAWEVYLLRCGDGTLYCGIALDAEARLEVHRSGKGARYTRGGAPWSWSTAKAVRTSPAPCAGSGSSSAWTGKPSCG